MNIREQVAAERRFFSAMGIVVFLVAFIGFSRSFYLDPLLPDVPKPGEPFYYAVHGPVFTAWMALIALQPWLIRRGNQQLHKKLGWIGLAVAIAVVVSGLWGGLLRAGGHAQMFHIAMPAKQAWATPFFSMMTFCGLVSCGFVWRKNAALHKRAMMMGTIAMLGAPFARWPIIGDWPPGFVRLFVEMLILVMVWHDWRTMRRVHAMTLWGGLSIIIAHRVLKPLIWTTDGWLAFTDWLLVMTGLS